MATDTREDAGQYYPGGDVIPTRPMPSGGGGTIVLDDTVTQSSSNGVKSSGIWTWVKGLLPNWLTPSYAEPATVASVNAKYTRPSSGIPASHLTTAVQAALVNARTPTAHAASHATGGSDAITPESIGAGTYSKPSGGIPKADLASAVQTSLDKADTSVQNTGGTIVDPSRNWFKTTFDGEEVKVEYVDLNTSTSIKPGKIYRDGYEIMIPQKAGTMTVNGVESFSAVGGVTPTVSGGVANLSSLFSSENTSLVSAVHTIVDAYYDNAETTNYPVS